jgi:UDP-glucose-4-epimerase GalE
LTGVIGQETTQWMQSKNGAWLSHGPQQRHICTNTPAEARGPDDDDITWRALSQGLSSHDLSMAPVLVIGGAGYLGSHLLPMLIGQGHHPVVLDDLSRGRRESVALHPKATMVQGSFGDRDQLAAVLRSQEIEAIIQVSTWLDLEDSWRQADRFYDLHGAHNLGLIQEAARYRPQNPPPLLFASSAAVFGDGGIEPLGEDADPSPGSPLGRSLLAAEWLIRDVGRSCGLDVVILRSFEMAGSDLRNGCGASHPHEHHLVPRAIRCARTQIPFPLYGSDFPTRDGTALRDLVDVTDVARAYGMALNHLLAGGGGGTYHLGSGHGTTVLEVLHLVERITAMKLTIDRRPRRPGEAAVLVADASLASQELGWRAERLAVDRIVADAAAWDAHLHSDREWVYG